MKGLIAICVCMQLKLQGYKMLDKRQALWVLKKSAGHLQLESWDGKAESANMTFLLQSQMVKVQHTYFSAVVLKSTARFTGRPESANGLVCYWESISNVVLFHCEYKLQLLCSHPVKNNFFVCAHGSISSAKQ